MHPQVQVQINVYSHTAHQTVTGHSSLIVTNTPAAESPSTWPPGSGALLSGSC